MKSLRFLNLADKAYDMVESLSYGEQKMVELARALAMNPKLLLLDEIASGLNTMEIETLSEALCQIRDQRIGIIIIEHNMPLVMSLSDSVLVLDFGEPIAYGAPEEISMDEKVIRAYLGQEENVA